MTDRNVLRVGAVAAVLGALVALVFNIIQPRGETAGVGEEVRLAAEEGVWAFNHYMLAVAIALVVLGLIVISRSALTEPSATWGRAAMYFAIGGSALIYASIVLRGSVMIAAATEGDPATAEAVAYVVGGLFTAAVGAFFGVVPLLYGVMVLTGRDYPAWLGWAGVLIGLAGLVNGSILFFDRFASDWVVMAFFPVVSVLFTLWVGVMGVLLWQKASAARPAV